MDMTAQRKPVVVETKRRVLSPKQAAEALFAKRAAQLVTPADHAVVTAIASIPTAPVDHVFGEVVTAPKEQPKTDHDKVSDLISDGKYEAAAKLAAKLINAGNDSGFFVYSNSAEYYLVESWFDRMVESGKKAKISEFCDLTPELAQILLLRNSGNRRVHPANLAVIMRDMASGRWMANGETIIVSGDGGLNDGQHRSFGALLTRSCVETAIAFGVDRSSMTTIDIGRKRTGGDRLGIGGVQNYVPMSAISNLIIEMKSGRAATPAETDQFFFENQQLIERSHSAAGSNMKGIGPSAAGAACAYLISSGYSQEDVASFFHAIRSGEMMPKRDPRMVLHKAIFDARFKVKTSRDNWVRAFVAHFLAMKAGKTMSSVTWETNLVWEI